MADTAVATDKKTTFSYEDLLNQLNQYQAKTDDEIRALAEAQVNSQYDSARLNAQQAADRTTQALQQQLSALAPSYDRQLQENQLAYDRAYSRADRQALSRGMQRSSYNAQVLANLLQEGNKAAGDIQAARTAQENNINANISQTAQQLADQLAQLENNRQNDLKAAEDALRDREYNRGQAQNELLLNLYQLAEQYGHTTPSTGAGTGVTGGGSSSGGYAYEMPESLKRQLGISTGSSGRTSGSSGSSSSSGRNTSSDTLEAFESDLFGPWVGLDDPNRPNVSKQDKQRAEDQLVAALLGGSSKTATSGGATGGVSARFLRADLR